MYSSAEKKFLFLVVLFCCIASNWSYTSPGGQTLNLRTDIQNINGTWNNLETPYLGSSGDIYSREYVPADVEFYKNPKLPNARFISNIVFNSHGGLFSKYNSFKVSEILPSWGIMLHLDITTLMRNGSDPWNIPVPKNDFPFDISGRGEEFIPFSRSEYIGIGKDSLGNDVRLHPNELTHWLDASGLYGKDEQTHRPMRGSRGLLNSIFLPVVGEVPIFNSKNNLFLFGHNTINVDPHLTIMNILLLREHNTRARMLAKLYPQWTDDEIFNRARRWVIAIVQKITLYQYYPVLLGEIPPPYTGYNKSVNPRIDLFFANFGLRYGHSALNSVMLRLDENGRTIPQGHVLLRDMMWRDGIDRILAVGMEPYIRGMIMQPEQEIDTYFSDDIRSHLPLAIPHGFDLAAIGVQRARDLMFPNYNGCRKAFGLPEAKTWSDITNDTVLIAKLEKTFQSIDYFDCYTGVFAEDKQNGILSSMQKAAMKDQFLRLRDGDRWWYEIPGVLTEDEMRELAELNMGTLITRNTNISWFPDNPFVALSENLVNPFLSKENQATTKTTLTSTKTIDFCKVRISWNLIEKSIMQLHIATNETGWFGFGLGKNMMNATIFLATNQYSEKREWSVYTCTSSNTISPIPALQFKLVANSISIDSHGFENFRGFQFNLSINNQISGFPQITNGRVGVITAWSSSENLQYHGPDNRCVGFVDFFAGYGYQDLLSPTSNIPGLKLLHGIMMAASTGFVIPAGIFVARHYKGINRWLTLHETLMTTFVSNVVVASITAIISGIGQFTSIHSHIGVVLTLLVGTSYTTGIVCGRWNPKALTKYSGKIRAYHRIMGWIIYLAAVGNATFGVYEFFKGSPIATYLFLSYLGFCVITVVTLLGFSVVKKSRQSFDGSVLFVQSNKAANPLNLPPFDWEEFNNRVIAGAQWIIVDGVIFDLASYMDVHPGGSKSLKAVIGLDATKYYNGVKTLSVKEDSDGSLRRRKSVFSGRPSKAEITLQTSSQRCTNVSMENAPEFSSFFHEHSRLAHYHLASLAVGVLRKESNGENHYGSYYIRKSNSIIKSKSMEVEHPQERSISIFHPKQAGKLRSNSLVVNIIPPIQETTTIKRTTIYQNQFETFPVTSQVISSKLARNKVLKVRIGLKGNQEIVQFLPGQHLLLQFADSETGQLITRAYNPIRCENIDGIDFIIKVYEQGLMTKNFENFTFIRMRGPINHAPRLWNGKSATGCWPVLGMICGGSGLTPMLQLIDHHIKKGPKDVATGAPLVQMFLLNMNKTDADMFFLQDLANLEQLSCGALTVTNLVTDIASAEWSGLVGKISPEIVQATLPPPQQIHNYSKSCEPKNLGDPLTATQTISSAEVSPKTISFQNFSQMKIQSIYSEENGLSQLQIPVNGIKSFSQSSGHDFNDAVSSLQRSVNVTAENHKLCDYSATSAKDFSGQLSSNADGLRIVICGPLVMNVAVSELLYKMGYAKDDVVTL